MSELDLIISPAYCPPAVPPALPPSAWRAAPFLLLLSLQEPGVCGN